MLKTEKKISCEKSYKEKIKEAWEEGMLYRFYAWLIKRRKSNGIIQN